MEIQTKKRVVVKLGSSLTISANQFNTKLLRNLAKQIKTLKQKGFEILLVCSGAVACGQNAIGFRKSVNKAEKQASAAVGQAVLITKLTTIFKKEGLTIGQLLFNKHCLGGNRQRQLIHGVFEKLIKKGVLPVINENDAISLNCFRGNDYLAAEIMQITGGEKLVILTNVEGLEGGNSVIHQISRIGNHIEEFVKNETSENGIGGMRSKLAVAKLLTSQGREVVVASGFVKGVLKRILIKNRLVGTRFLAQGV